MSHEQSETIQDKDGNWINVYGKKTPNAGKQLPNSGKHKTVGAAVKEAKERSDSFNMEREAERPVRKSEAGRYEGIDRMPDDYMKMPDTHMKDVHDVKRMKK